MSNRNKKQSKITFVICVCRKKILTDKEMDLLSKNLSCSGNFFLRTEMLVKVKNFYASEHTGMMTLLYFH